LHYWQGVPSADSVEKLHTLIHGGVEGVNSARRVLSNQFSGEKYQSNALWCMVEFQWQSFSTLSVGNGPTPNANIRNG
jgi:hypothetical protein